MYISAALQIYSYDIKSRIWNQVSQETPFIVLNSIHWLDNSIYAIGRLGHIIGFKKMSVYKFDLEKLNWTEIKCFGDEPTARNHHASFSYKNELYIFGGIS